jgi:hypothetical protein
MVEDLSYVVGYAHELGLLVEIHTNSQFSTNAPCVRSLAREVPTQGARP